MPPHPEQQEILDAQDRIRLVEAAPGSGKTWLVAEAIRLELDTWENRYQGIAALSFTNVAGEEIRKSLGRDLAHPHFVGTLDSFLFRFVVKPFARLRDAEMPQPVLVPGEQANRLTREQWWLRDHLEINLGSRQRSQRKNIFDINFIGGTRRAPKFATMLNWNRYELNRDQANTAIQKKRDIWRSSGRISHSDAAYMAFQILSDRNIGPDVVSLIVNRFPAIFLDEIQDTGWFLGKSVLEILANDQCRALVVGDPDQAIYEFNGASPEIFQDIALIDDVGELEIQTTIRCSEAVCTVARNLSAGERDLVTARETVGRVVLAIHDGEVNSPRELIQLLSQIHPNGVHKLVARTNATVHKLNDGPDNEYPRFGSKPVSNLHDAVNSLRRGKMRTAYSLSEAMVGRSLLNTESPSPAELEVIQTDSFQWKKIVVQILLAANMEIEGESLYQWGLRVISQLRSTLQDIGWWNLAPNPRVPNRPNRANTEHELRADWLVNPEPDHGPRRGKATTVHAVKGETHDTTILYVPEPRRRNLCPSEIWWSDDEQHSEERRIAYVAATRPKNLFVLCSHRNSVENFRVTRPEFFEGFELMELADLVAEYDALVEGGGP